MSFGEGDLHVKAAKLQERVDSLEVTNGELCAEINRQERRIRQLEALVRDTYRAWCFECDPWDGSFACEFFDGSECDIKRRMHELGIEVD